MKRTTKTNGGKIRFTKPGAVALTDAYAAGATQKEREYLLNTLDADKLLYWFHRNAKLTPLASRSYGGQWEGALIGGHFLGHYLSALALSCANANMNGYGDAFGEKIEHIVGELKKCQNNAVGAGAKKGFIWGARSIDADNPEIQFDNVENGKTNIVSQAWVPWYTMHKILQGLIDACVFAGSATAKEVAVSLGDWVCNRVDKWSDALRQRVLGVEYGGMNDCLYNLYAVTGDGKYAVAAHAFDEESLFEKILKEPRNYLDGLHANTTIPKIIGALNRYILCDGKIIGGEEIDAGDYLSVAEKFWSRVTRHHTYITGGNSEWEHFGRDGVLDKRRTNCNCETCNTYNMLKLSRMLFTVTGNKKYLDFYENAYYNAILSSQNPETGMTTYFQPMATGYFKVFSSPADHFWCCTGSGMESFAKLNDSIYYESDGAVYVSLYVGSTYRSDAVSFTQTADLENFDTVSFRIDGGKTVLNLRKPDWTKSFSVSVNGRAVETDENDSFVPISVKKGDFVTVDMEKAVVAYDLPDGKDVLAFKYGPFVLSARLGDERMNQTTTGVNVAIPQTAVGDKTYSVNARNLDAFKTRIGEYLKKSGKNEFILQCKNGSLAYSYHFKQYRQRYGIYFRFTAAEDGEETAPLVWYTQDTVMPGYGQYESDGLHDMRETNTVGETGVPALGTTRAANEGGSFTYRVIVDKTKQNRLAVHFAKADNGKSILIQSGDTPLYRKTLGYAGTEDSYGVEIPLPDSLVQSAADYERDGQTVSVLPVTFCGVDGAASARVCSFVYSQYAVDNRKRK